MNPLRTSAKFLRAYFPTLDEWFFGAVPASLSYQPLFSLLGADQQDILAFIFGLIILFAFIQAFRRVYRRRKALSEILATGYHINFVDHLERCMSARNSVAVKGSQRLIDRVRITLPRNVKELASHMTEVNGRIQSGELVEVTYAGRTVTVEIDTSRVVLWDYPRTLESLSEYLTQENDTNVHGDVPSRYYKWFGAHLKGLKKRRPGSLDRFDLVDVRGNPY